MTAKYTFILKDGQNTKLCIVQYKQTPPNQTTLKNVLNIRIQTEIKRTYSLLYSLAITRDNSFRLTTSLRFSDLFKETPTEFEQKHDKSCQFHKS